MKKTNNSSFLNTSLIATNKKWNAKWTRVAHILGLINAVEYDLLTTIKNSISVEDLFKYISPGEREEYSIALLFMARKELIHLENPIGLKEKGFVQALMVWERENTRG